MANLKAIWIETYEAGADLSAKQFYGVKFSADRKVVLTAAVTDRPCGILQNKPKSGEAAEVMIIGRTGIVNAETLVAGDEIEIDAAGKAAKHVPGTDTTKYGVGHVSVGGAADVIGEANVCFANAGRGA